MSHPMSSKHTNSNTTSQHGREHDSRGRFAPRYDEVPSSAHGIPTHSAPCHCCWTLQALHHMYWWGCNAIEPRYNPSGHQMRTVAPSHGLPGGISPRDLCTYVHMRPFSPPSRRCANPSCCSARDENHQEGGLHSSEEYTSLPIDGVVRTVALCSQ